MTPEEKQLLLIELCARMPHNVTCQFTWTYCNETTDGEEVIAKENDNIRSIDIHTKEIQADYYGEWVDLEYCKPYLRPMSSMTEKEKREVREFGVCDDGAFHNDVYDVGTSIEEAFTAISWFLERHFDINYLIQKGLALEAPEDMYKNK